MKTFYKILILLFLVFGADDIYGQRLKRTSTKKQAKEAVQKQEDTESKMLDDLHKDRKKHRDNQDKKTKKRMKKSSKKSKKIAQGKTAPFYKRWFHRKHF